MNAGDKKLDVPALVAKFPTPGKEGKLDGADKAAMDGALAGLQAGGREAVLGLVAMLKPPEKGGDSQARHALHALCVRVGGPANVTARKTVAEALAAALGSGGDPEVKRFVVRQLQVCGGAEAVPALARLIGDEALGEDAVLALTAIRQGSAEPLRTALPAAKGRRKLVLVQSLGALADPASAPALRPLLADPDRDTRLAAGWALARIGDAASADTLLKAASGEGTERIKATQACLLLAERLAATGRKTEAARVYQHLRDTRTDPSEAYIREAAARGLAATGPTG